MSGPAALDMSRHWHRVRVRGEGPRLTINVCPGETFETLDAWVVEQQRQRPKAQIRTVLAQRLPAAVAESWLTDVGVDPSATMSHLARDDRRRIVHALIGTALDVRDSRGYGYAEVTAGGVPLDEIDPASMESRVCPGLYLTGEMLDVDGRLGGFNFQWAWSSGWVAGQALGRRRAEVE